MNSGSTGAILLAILILSLSMSQKGFRLKIRAIQQSNSPYPVFVLALLIWAEICYLAGWL